MAIDLLSSGLSAGCFFFLIWRLAEPRNRYVKGPAVFLCFAAVIAGIGGKWDNLPLLGVLYLLLELLFAGSRMLKLYLATGAGEIYFFLSGKRLHEQSAGRVCKGV